MNYKLNIFTTPSSSQIKEIKKRVKKQDKAFDKKIKKLMKKYN